jgi:glycerol-3-phosphate acyltransferase PlsY
MISLATIVVLSFVLGSIPGSLWAGKMMHGIDVREHGSGNAGATNTFRVLGWKAGVIATLIDVGKGFIAAGLIAKFVRIDALPQDLPFWNVNTLAQMLAGIGAVAGHMFPMFAGFRGGKGMNTAGGVLFAITPVSMAVTMIVFILVLLTTRTVSLASLTATLAFPISVGVRKYYLGIEQLDASLFIISIVISAGLIWAHRSNIRRLMDGTESRVRSFRPARGQIGKGELSK